MPEPTVTFADKTVIDGRYRILKFLGCGGMGAVYSAHDLQTQLHIAVKVLNPPSAQTPSYRHFQREFHLLSQIKHPRIVRTRDWGTHEGWPYFTMDLVPGRALSAILKDPEQRDRIRAKAFPALALQIGEALEHIHNHNLVHLDLKPSNIMIAETEGGISATLLDFGLARFHQSTAPARAPSDAVTGTAEYLSPEQAQGAWVDHRADLYALGVILYEIATGGPPFTGPDALSVLLQHIRQDPEFPQTSDAAVDPSFRQIILKLLQKEPINRYQSAEGFLDAIQALNGRHAAKRTLPRALYPRFSGREQELLRLRSLLSDPPKESPKIILISGEAGIGKSRLQEELQNDARTQNLQTITARCEETPSASHMAILDALGEWDEPPSNVTPMDILRRLEQHMGHRPMLFCIEDIQWADEWTRSLLRILTYEALPLILCLTYRNAKKTVPGWIEVLLNKSKSIHLHLNVLSPEETGHLIASILGEKEIPQNISDPLYRETGGHPLFTTEMTRALLDAGILKRDTADRWHLHPPPQNWLPESLAELLQKRIQSLPSDLRHILECASIFQGAFSFEHLQAVCESPEKMLFDHLSELINRDLLRTQTNHYHFSHALFQTAVYQKLSPQTLRTLHRRAGRYLEHRHKDRVEALAYHFSESCDHECAYPYLIQAAKRAGKAQNFKQALEYYAQAAVHYDFKKKSPLTLEETKRDIEFWCDYAYTLWFRSLHSDAMKKLDHAFVLIADGMPLLKAEAFKIRGYIYQVTGRKEDSENDLQYALAIFRRHQHIPGQFQTLNHLSNLYDYMGRFEDASAYAHQTSEIFNIRYGKTRVIEAQLFPGRAAFQAGRFEEAQQRLGPVLKGSTESNDPDFRQRCLKVLNRIAFFNGQFDTARNFLQDFITINRRRGATGSEALGLIWMGELFFEHGEFARTKSLAHEALHLMSETNNHPSLPHIHALLAAASAKIGEIGEALQWAKRAEVGIPRIVDPESEHLPGTWCGIASAYAASGQIEKAEKAFESAIASRGKIRAGEPIIARIKAGAFYLTHGKTGLARQHLKAAADACEEMGMAYFAEKAKTMHEQTTAQTRLQTLYHASEDLISILDLNQLLDAILQRILTESNASRAIVALKNASGRVDIVRTHNVPGTAAEEISRGILLEAIEQNKVILSMNASQDERFHLQQSVIDYNIQSVLCLPLHHVSAGVIGALYVDHKGLTDFFTNADEAFLKALGHLISIAIINARTHTELKEKALHLQEQLEAQNAFGELIGSSPPMQRTYSLLHRASQTDITVLLQGETGTGKELAARAIHYNSARKRELFFAQNCSAISDELLQSELFGHKKGAFTGAAADRVGIFEAANGGTVFLDEIGDASPQVQASLLRVLQNGEIRRLGDNALRRVGVRVIAATNRNLEADVQKGTFRQDLYYRLCVLRIDMPPLRNRPEDIPLLADHFLKRFSEQTGKSFTGFTQRAVKALAHYAWPGNVRELENEIQRAVVLSSKNGAITADLFTDRIHTPQPLLSHSEQTLKDQVETLEKQRIAETLQNTGGNITRAASELGLTRHGLYKKLARYGLSKNENLST